MPSCGSAPGRRLAGEAERGRCVFALRSLCLPFFAAAAATALGDCASITFFADGLLGMFFPGDGDRAGLPVGCLEFDDEASDGAADVVCFSRCRSVSTWRRIAFSRGVDSGRFLRGAGAAASISAHRLCVSLMYGPLTHASAPATWDAAIREFFRRGRPAQEGAPKGRRYAPLPWAPGYYFMPR